MTPAEFQARMKALLDAEYKAIGGDEFRAKFSDKKTQELVRAGASKRLAAECERDPEFKEAVLGVKAEIIFQLDPEDQPHGAYRADAVVRIAEDRLVMMRWLTRDTLLQWALHESDEDNLDYIRRALDKWEERPEIELLGELEAALGN